MSPEWWSSPVIPGLLRARLHAFLSEAISNYTLVMFCMDWTATDIGTGKGKKKTKKKQHDVAYSLSAAGVITDMTLT